MGKSMSMDHLALGVCYYPEHWPEEMWQDDLGRMRAHGIEYARVAEFAWSKFEMRENEFAFDFFDRFLDLAHLEGVKVVFCTPTATPPAWLTHKYPETLNATVDGTPYRHGLRRHYNYNSPKYRELTARLVENISMHYCPHPAIAGWQIDNELNCEVDAFYSESDHSAFREYLKDKYKTLDSLNEHMGTVFWNQTYTDWEEIFLTRPTVKGNTNPHMALEEKRFFSRSANSFCALQADIIRKYAPEGQWITTNGIFGHLDSHEMTERSLDFISFDSYPAFALGGGKPNPADLLRDRGACASLSRARAISDNFCVMEQQSGAGGWDARMRMPMPKPGQMRLWTYQSFAHGADMVSYFRWRTCTFGTEIYWHGLNDYDNRDNRRTRELMLTGREIAKLGALAGAKYQARVALLRDYDNEWDGEQDIWHGPLRRASELVWQQAAQHSHAPMDFLYMRDNVTPADLSRYDFIVYPHAAILTPERATLLTQYVEAGGTLLMGPRTGYKDPTGRCPMTPMPGPAASLLGVTVESYTAMGAYDAQRVNWGPLALDAEAWVDVFRPACDGIEVLGVYSSGPDAGLPALTLRRAGKGQAYSYGTGFTYQSATAFLTHFAFAEPYAYLFDLPSDVEIAERRKGNQRYIFLMNFSSAPQPVNIKTAARDLLTGESPSGWTTMPGYGVMVLAL